MSLRPIQTVHFRIVSLLVGLFVGVLHVATYRRCTPTQDLDPVLQTKDTEAAQ